MLTTLIYSTIPDNNFPVGVCDATKQLYQDYACCGGSGHSVCTSEQFNATQLMDDIKIVINNAVDRISNANNM